VAVRDDWGLYGTRVHQNYPNVNESWPMRIGRCLQRYTEDAGEAEAKCEASGVSAGEVGYAGIDRLGMTGASLGIGTQGVSKGFAEPELELALLWWVNGAGAG